jgi:hypothetical protein
MRASADQWTQTPEAGLIMSPAIRISIIERLRLAYIAGLRDGERREADLMGIAYEKKSNQN